MSPDGKSIVCGDQKGNFYFLNLVGFEIGAPVVTQVRIWLCGDNGGAGTWAYDITAVCSNCGKRFVVDERVVGKESGFPECGRELRFNPFVVDNRDRYD